MEHNEGKELTKSQSLVERRAKLIEYQNQISWIASDFAKSTRGKTSAITNADLNLYVMLYENLNTIIKQLKDCDLEKHLSPAYKERVNDLMRHIKIYIVESRTRRLSDATTLNVINNDANSEL